MVDKACFEEPASEVNAAEWFATLNLWWHYRLMADNFSGCEYMKDEKHYQVKNEYPDVDTLVSFALLCEEENRLKIFPCRFELRPTCHSSQAIAISSHETKHIAWCRIDVREVSPERSPASCSTVPGQRRRERPFAGTNLIQPLCCNQ